MTEKLQTTEPDRERIERVLEWLHHEAKYHSAYKHAYPAWYMQAIQDCHIIVSKRLGERLPE